MTRMLWLAAAFAVSAVVSGGLIKLLAPMWRHYALAKPNARSSHKHPTPQGGGIAVILATTCATGLAIAAGPIAGDLRQILIVFTAILLLAVVGAIDDIRVLAASPRLALQMIAVVIVVAAMPADLRPCPALPWWIERALIFFAFLWFVNLVNFMDGIDWMTVAEVVPLAAGLSVFGVMGALPGEATLAALALCGALVGFAPSNRPVAKLFLGDVGSLPIGLLVAWLLVLLAGYGHLAAALLLPLYYLADATITLLGRLIRGEPVMQAHRSHFYQRALDNGFSVYQIVGRVFTTNIILVALAAVTVINTSPVLQLTMLAAGIGLVGALLWIFGRSRP